MLPNFLRETQALLPQLRRWRRQLHAHPELGFAEQKTAAFVAQILRAAGWKVKTGVARTGVVGLLPAAPSGRTLAIRADMDALPIQEQNQVAYRSQVAGVMHACGHDGNMAMVLGAAWLLPRFRQPCWGNIKLIFQPCEERTPGGAQAMIAAQVLKHPQVDAIFAAHVDTSVPAGSIALKSGPIMANADFFSLTIQGQGGHGAMPQKSVDAVAVAGQVITALQQVVAREMNPLEPAVVTIGQIVGGTAHNIIADKVQLKGTLRSLFPQQRMRLARRVSAIAQGVCRALRAHCQFTLERGHPAFNNHPKITTLVRQAGYQVLGRSKVLEMRQPMMAGEDFSYYAARIPACFFFVGVEHRRRKFTPAWHHAEFDFIEQGLVYGTAVMIQTVWDYFRP